MSLREMSPSARLKAAKAAFGRRHGASPETREKIAAAESKMEWRGCCRKCKTPLKGLLSELKEHRCG